LRQKQQKLLENSTPTNADPGYIIPMAITVNGQLSTRELFKPSKDS